MSFKINMSTQCSQYLLSDLSGSVVKGSKSFLSFFLLRNRLEAYYVTHWFFWSYVMMQYSNAWQQILRQNFTDVEKLADFLELDSCQRTRILSRKDFPLNLPKRLAEKIVKNNLEDPILKQFVPLIDEQHSSENFVLDPLGESVCRKSGKLLHKYQGRVLLVCTSACAMHCRYCFRQHFGYELEKKEFEEELNYISNDNSIREVILSGGDPLSFPDSRLKDLFSKISRIQHVRRVRFHTRFPIGIPERIDTSFCDLLESLKKQVWFVVHVNHPLELDEEVSFRLTELRKRGVVVLNQSVLLKGVNDSVQVLIELFEKLADQGIIPYYIHQLDRVQGANHFEVDLEEGKRLMKEVEKQVSGYAFPKYAREEAGGSSKTLLY